MLDVKNRALESARFCNCLYGENVVLVAVSASAASFAVMVAFVFSAAFAVTMMMSFVFSAAFAVVVSFSVASAFTAAAVAAAAFAAHAVDEVFDFLVGCFA